MLNDLMAAWLRESSEGLKMCQWCESKIYQLPGKLSGVSVDGNFFCFACEDAFHVSLVCDYCSAPAPKDALNTDFTVGRACMFCKAHCCDGCLDLFSEQNLMGEVMCLGCSSKKILSEHYLQSCGYESNKPEPLSGVNYSYRKEARELFLSSYIPKPVNQTPVK